MRFQTALALLASILLLITRPASSEVRAESVAIIYSGAGGLPERHAAEMLQERITKRTGIQVELAEAAASLPNAEVYLSVGTPGTNPLSRELLEAFQAHRPTLPDSDKLHPEGFVVKSGTFQNKHYVLVAGNDQRGTIYGAGWLLRAMTHLPGALLVPEVDAVEKPAFFLRGGNPRGPGSRAREYGDLRPQSAEEYKEIWEDFLLLGTNLFEGDPEELRGNYSLMTYSGRTLNEMPVGFPREWAADDGRSEKYVCPSDPEARAALLASFDEQFRNGKRADFFMTNSGDVGGCRCERCEPWGATYVKLLREVADILHKYHPDTKIQATNQDLTNEGNRAIFEYLNSGDSSWLFAIRYGPGADEMQEYIRGPVNPEWFEYEGFGPLGNYLKYMHHELPRTTTIALYTDITHWMQAQYAVPKPDVALAALNDRRSWNARPRNFHKVGQEILHYAIGDHHYSEGIHDDFNKWFWYRLLWNPHQSAEALTAEYCRYWFGPEAEAEAAEAVFLMEETLEKPLVGNPGIQRAVEMLRAAGEKIPENLLKLDWRWRIMMQKALMDRYQQLQLERGEALKQDAAQALSGEGKPARARLEAARAVLDQPQETQEMIALRDEAKLRGEESNKVVGYREPGAMIVDRFDLTEVGWWLKTIDAALALDGEEHLENTVRMLLYYEDPGEGGFYEDLGWPNKPQHLTQGQTLWGFRPFPGPARLSHYNLAYSYGSRRGNVTFKFDGLDPDAKYVVRISTGGRAGGRRAEGVQLSEAITADDRALGEDFFIPTSEVGFFEFDVPQEATTDGEVEIALVPGNEEFPITTASEIWLMRRDKMPWAARL